ncbi:hypothetical protein PBCVCVM1_907R [Paramecium bursaria Chlorella virus CVM-1]|uniref:Uncharacterized protein N759R n=1 Tax=Paramecium bursaria Chlorella virus FR483 TaxID=399781 RepID=A7J8B3_PBCVF|nr:hypothetical protein FR483_N759R [Paramecium bursaria Chlorella virus FR483]ABT16044.1 hypothetical protein FR483_N759R [Paramecium bursaria Chlorella virus FR483]AGE51003.1 hypothetical protein PBCVCVB1_869R [Paramecium bursaria Chlorella virus CVB-1]AGE51329.1 hypothetical protein PBCVCVG1_875R [Paramecium bursaria Chlorella virus CVG-1]AGE52003.1 hypothetical protein PBCVCVM1_907R [Paramecium bursaria Chlorella virus CVM-1]
MDASLLKSKKRGKYFQLMYDEKPIEIPFKNCLVVRPVYDKYIRLDISLADGNKGNLLLIHNYIKNSGKSDFSPLKYAAENNSWSDIVCKISNASWEPYEQYLNSGDPVDVVFTVSAFGNFGFFLTIKHITKKIT